MTSHTGEQRQMRRREFLRLAGGGVLAVTTGGVVGCGGGASKTSVTRTAQIAFTDDDGTVYLINVDGSGQHQIVPSRGGGRQLSWSPDGMQLAISSASQTILLIGLDGSLQRTITVSLASNRFVEDVAWSPADDSVIAFTDDDGGVHLMKSDGSGQVQILSGRGGGRLISWSPDGNQLAVPSDDLLTQAHQIAVIGADGTVKRTINVSLGSNGSVVEEVGWSPSGTQFAYSDDDGNVFLVNADGSGQRQIATGGQGGSTFSWSPDSTELAIGSASHPKQILIVGTDGTVHRTIGASLAGNGTAVETVVWSPTK